MEEQNLPQQLRHPDDENELMDYLRVVWKWKYLILLGTLVAAAGAALISWQMPRVYSIEMVLRPGILRVNEEGKNTYIGSTQNIKAIIEAGTFDNDILKHLDNPGSKDAPRSLKFKMTLPPNSDALKVSYESANKVLGVKIMSRLARLLEARYDKLVKYYQSEYDAKIGAKKAEIADRRASLASSRETIRNLEKRARELAKEIRLINANTRSLLKERKTFLSDRSSTANTFSWLVYTNTIQQNIALANSYKQELAKCLSDKKDEKLFMETAQNSIKKLHYEIKDLQYKKQSIQNIQVVKPPSSSLYPVRPKTRLNILLAGVVGLFVMLFAAFFLEYIGKYRSAEQQQSMEGAAAKAGSTR